MAFAHAHAVALRTCCALQYKYFVHINNRLKISRRVSKLTYSRLIYLDWDVFCANFLNNTHIDISIRLILRFNEFIDLPDLFNEGEYC